MNTAQKRAGGAFALLAVGALALTACAGGQPEGSADAVPKIAVLTGDISDFGQVQMDAIETVVTEAGGTSTVINGGDDTQTQDTACQDIITSGQYNALILNSSNASAATLCAQDAIAAGIAVVGLETPIGADPNKVEVQIEGQTGSVAWSPYELGENQFQLVKDACAGIDPCKVGQTIGFKGYTLDIGRLQAFDDGLKANPSIQIVAQLEDNYDAATGLAAVEDILRANPDVNVIVNASDSVSVQAAQAVADAGLTDQVTIIGDGGSRAGVEAIKAGKIDSSVASWPGELGRQAALMAVAAVKGEPITDNAISMYDLGEMLGGQPVLLRADNVDQFTPEWG